MTMTMSMTVGFLLPCAMYHDHGHLGGARMTMTMTMSMTVGFLLPCTMTMTMTI